MRWLCRRLCGMHPARVIHGSGQVLYFSPRTTVEEVLRYHPHHFLCQPGLNIYSGWSSNQMLAMDTELQSGCVYFLLPLPRLFPANPSSQSCRCYQSQNVLSQTPNRVLKHIQSPTCRSSFIFYGSPRRVEGLQSPFRSSAKGMWCFRSCCKNSKSNKISPESNLYGGTDILTSTPLYLPWRPRLGCISEEDDVAVSLEDVKRYCRKLWRKDHQAVNQLSSPNRSPATSPFN